MIAGYRRHNGSFGTPLLKCSHSNCDYKKMINYKSKSRERESEALTETKLETSAKRCQFQIARIIC